jgi:glycosyltransferase involved in cell wall biosynthesis
MRIAFDLRRIGNLGVGRYMACLVNAITREAPQHQYSFIMTPGTQHLLSCVSRGQVICSSAPYYSVAEQFALPMILKKYRIDLLHALHFVVPLVKVCPTIVTLHDAIHFVYPQDLPSRLGRVYSRAMMKAAARSADRILTVSEYSKSDIVRYLDVNPGKITVTYAPLDERFHKVRNEAPLLRIRRRLGITGDFLLYTGIFRERKNHLGLLNAFAILLAGGVRVQLVIAGNLGAGEKSLRDRAVELGIEKPVVFAGFVSEEDLPSLYTAAKTYVCPSLYEGFGQTLIEAMACGTPVVSHNGTSLPEVCGDAALLADVHDADKFAGQIRRSIEDADARHILIEKGHKNAARFDACRTAQRTLRAYSEALGGRL